MKRKRILLLLIFGECRRNERDVIPSIGREVFLITSKVTCYLGFSYGITVNGLAAVAIVQHCPHVPSDIRSKYKKVRG